MTLLSAQYMKEVMTVRVSQAARTLVVQHGNRHRRRLLAVVTVHT